MDSSVRTFAPYVLGLVLIGVAVAGVVPAALAAAFGVLGVGLMAAYAFRVVRSGGLGGGHMYPEGTPGYWGDGSLGVGDVGHHHGGHGDGGWSGGDGGGGGGGDGGGGG
jgi:uncharacterized membrane protein YgcG